MKFFKAERSSELKSSLQQSESSVAANFWKPAIWNTLLKELFGQINFEAACNPNAVVSPSETRERLSQYFRTVVFTGKIYRLDIRDKNTAKASSKPLAGLIPEPRILFGLHPRHSRS